MQGKILFVAGFVTGYVIGTRVGHQGYERLKKQAIDLWRSPEVQKTVASAGEFAREKVPVVGEFVGVLAKKASTQGDDVAPKHVADTVPSDAGGAAGEGHHAGGHNV